MTKYIVLSLPSQSNIAAVTPYSERRQDLSFLPIEGTYLKQLASKTGHRPLSSSVLWSDRNVSCPSLKNFPNGNWKRRVCRKQQQRNSHVQLLGEISPSDRISLAMNVLPHPRTPHSNHASEARLTDEDVFQVFLMLIRENRPWNEEVGNLSRIHLKQNSKRLERDACFMWLHSWESRLGNLRIAWQA